MSLISLAIGGAAGMFKFIVGKHLENKHQQQMALVQNTKLLHEGRKNAAEIRDSGISFTRRILALIFAAALTAPIFYGIVFPDTLITVPESFIDRGLWGWILPFGGEEMTRYIEVKAPVVALPIYDICAMIIGFYFGSGGSRVR